jgi:peptide subunit release factor 1 (eRF1)
MLRDLRSVKVRPVERKKVDLLRDQFQRTGTISTPAERWLHDVCRRYSKQLSELHDARDRAHRTNALRSLGMTRAQAAQRVQERAAAEVARSNDLGF